MAETIEATIIDMTNKKSIDVARLRGFGSDGAPVMTGCRNGVATKATQYTLCEPQTCACCCKTVHASTR